MKRMIGILKSKRGEGSYIGSVVFILTAVIFIAFTVNIFSVIHAKQQMDTCADQLVRQIQLSGEVSTKTDSLFNSLCGSMQAVKDISYTVSTTYCSGKKIQLGTPFQVAVKAKAYIGGFGDFGLFPVNLVSTAGGVSEEYWK